MQMTLTGELIKEKPRKWKPQTKQHYGIPYTGNKQKIAKYIFDNLPSGERFIDLFGGGGAMTHYAMLNCTEKYNEFVYNDINPLIVDLFKRAVNGEFNPSAFKPKFITKEEYQKTHLSDGYVAYIWSFGNNNKSYLFGEGIMEFKEKAHNWVVFGDTDSLSYLEEHYKDSYYWHIKHLYQGEDYVLARKMYTNVILKIEAIRVCRLNDDWNVYNLFKDYSFNEFLDLSNKELVNAINKYIPDIPKKNYKNTSDKVRLHKLKQLQQLQRLERLEQLEQLQQLEIININYQDFKPQKGDVVYCDIPYDSKTVKYENEFDAEAFFEWCKKQPVPIYYSYYTTGEVLWSKPHRTSNIGKAGLRYEGLMKI